MPSDDPQPLLNTCPSCQEIIDVSGVRPYEKIHCPLCGDTIRVRTTFNHFTLKEEIGQGGMSRVFRAIDNNLGREVALKILHSRLEDQADLADQFIREARITASINHPHVVQVYSVGNDQGYFYIAMELLPSRSLEQRIEGQEKLPEAEALRIGLQVAQGLAAAYEHGLIHRDVKPGNILLDHDGCAKLVDFGLALIQGTEEDPLAEVWATPFYVPPEKLWNRTEDFRSDIYSLGATLYHMIAGKPPHLADTDSIQELITIKSEPLDLRAADANMHGETLQLIARMMAYDPPARPASYPELLEDMERTLRKVDPQMRHASATEGFPLWAQIIAGLVAVGFFGGLAVLVMGGGKPESISPADSSSNSPSGGRSSEHLVVRPGDANLSRLLPGARQALARGEPETATTLLRDLALNEDARDDWRAWAWFHLGLESLLDGELEASREPFRQAAERSLTLDQTLTDFFADVSEGIQEDGPAPPPKKVSSPSAGLQSLVFALKNWSRGNFGGARLHLERFLEARYTGSSAWAEVYRPRAKTLLEDAGLVTSLPEFPAGAAEPELQAHLEELREVRMRLSEPEAQSLADEAILRAQKRLEVLVASRENEAMAADTARLLEARRSVADLVSNRQFEQAASKWREVGCESPFGKRMVRFHAEACEAASRFVELFAGRVGDYRYEGEIIRKEGRTFSAKVLRATPDSLAVDLGFGPTPLKMDSISSEGIVRIAAETVLQGEDPEVLEAGSFYAWYTGHQQEAREAANRLQDVPEFVQRWDAVTRPLSEE